MIKIVFLGGGGVGKSALILRFLHGELTPDDVGYDLTIEESYRRDMMVDGKSITIEIVDTSGQEERSAMREQYFYTANVVVLVAAYRSKFSLYETPLFAECLKRARGTEQVPIILVGVLTKGYTHEFTRAQLENAAAKMNAYACIDASAFDEGQGVNEIFETAVRAYLKSRIPQQKSSRLSWLKPKSFSFFRSNKLNPAEKAVVDDFIKDINKEFTNDRREWSKTTRILNKTVSRFKTEKANFTLKPAEIKTIDDCLASGEKRLKATRDKVIDKMMQTIDNSEALTSPNSKLTPAIIEQLLDALLRHEGASSEQLESYRQLRLASRKISLAQQKYLKFHEDLPKHPNRKCFYIEFKRKLRGILTSIDVLQDNRIQKGNTKVAQGLGAILATGLAVQLDVVIKPLQIAANLKRTRQDNKMARQLALARADKTSVLEEVAYHLTDTWGAEIDKIENKRFNPLAQSIEKIAKKVVSELVHFMQSDALKDLPSLEEQLVKRALANQNKFFGDIAPIATTSQSWQSSAPASNSNFLIQQLMKKIGALEKALENTNKRLTAAENKIATLEGQEISSASPSHTN